MKIIILTEKDMKEIFTMKDAIQASKDALEMYSKGWSQIPLRTNIDIQEEKGQSLYMPGYVAGVGALGVKLVSLYSENNKKGIESISSMMVLKNHETGQVSSIMDGTYLTKLRTGALAGAATDILSRKDSSIFALFGTGGQAESQLEAILNVRHIKEVRVYGRNQEKAQIFVDEMEVKFGEKYKVDILRVESPEEAVIDADIITCVTTATNPVFDGKLVKKGAHINGMGSYTPTMQEIDPYILYNADKILLDTRDGVLRESGDFLIPMAENKFSESDINGELGEVIMGKLPARESDNEISFFKSVGSSVLDLVTAKKIYDKALDMGLGQIIEF